MPESQPDSRKGRWWNQERLALDRPFLEWRAKGRRSLEVYFDQQGFVPVETPAIQYSPGLDPHIAAFQTRLAPAGRGFERSGPVRYLHTSPEFSMKKLLAGGMKRIWQLAPVYRNGDQTRFHHPEFTLLEWYRAAEPIHKPPDHITDLYDADQPVRAVIQDIENIICRFADLAGGVLRRCFPPDDGRSDILCDPSKGLEVLTVVEAFQTFCGIDLEAAMGEQPLRPDPRPLRDEARRLSIHCAPDDQFDDLFFRIFLEKIEPHLGHPKPLLLRDYPISMAALAREKTVYPKNESSKEPRWAERFELYVAGVELANGFGELTDPVEQKRRFMADRQAMKTRYGRCYPIDPDFLSALSAMPPAAGVALGFDRLLMLAAGACDIKQVLWAWVE